MKASSDMSPDMPVIDCEAAMRRLWDYLDDELDAVRFTEMEAHLATCAGCTSHVTFARAFLAAVRSAAQDEVTEDAVMRSATLPSATPSALRTRVVEQLTREGFRPSG